MRLLARGRTHAEFEDFVTKYADGLLRTAFLITSDRAEAEDLLQDCLLRVAKGWPRVRTMEHPDLYVRRILVNLALRGAGRRTRRTLELAAGPGDEAGGPFVHAVSDGTEAFGRRDELIEAMRMLPPRQRVVLVLRYFEDLSETQIAEMLSCSTATVKSTASRGLARLRDALNADPPQQRDLPQRPEAEGQREPGAHPGMVEHTRGRS